MNIILIETHHMHVLDCWPCVTRLPPEASLWVGGHIKEGMKSVLRFARSKGLEETRHKKLYLDINLCTERVTFDTFTAVLVSATLGHDHRARAKGGLEGNANSRGGAMVPVHLNFTSPACILAYFWRKRLVKTAGYSVEAQ